MDEISVNATNPKDPKVTIDKHPFQVNETTTKVLKKGTGATITDKDTVLVDYVALNGANTKQLVSTFTSKPVSVPIGDPQQFPGLVTALKGATVGTSEVVAIPPKDGFGGQGSSQLGVTNKDTLVFYIEVRAVQPKEASGKTETPKAGFPTVSVPKDNTAPATITMPKGAKEPTKTEVETLITGSGPKVAKGQSVTVAYTGALWKDGKVFDASAKSGAPATFTLADGQLIPGFIKGLVGQTVGSRVVIVMPPADGYGDKAQTNPQTGETMIPAKSTLVFVVDILAAQ